MVYSMLATLYANKFKQHFKTTEALQVSRRTWAREIGRLTGDQIKEGFDLLKRKVVEGDPEFLWPDIPRIIRLMSGDKKFEDNWEQRVFNERSRDQELRLPSFSDHPELKEASNKARIIAMDLFERMSDESS